MNKTVQDDKDDIDIYEESSYSESQRAMPGSSPEGDDVQEDKEMKNRIIRKEEKDVRNARLLLIAAVMACAVAVSVAIYIFASRSDQSTFELEVSNRQPIYTLQPAGCSCSIVHNPHKHALTVLSTLHLMTQLLV
jgi:hypothetical protein